MIPPNQKNLMVQRAIENARRNFYCRHEQALIGLTQRPDGALGHIPPMLKERLKGKLLAAKPVWGWRRTYAPPKYLPRVEDAKHAKKKKDKNNNGITDIPSFLDQR